MALLQKAYLGSTALFRNEDWFEDTSFRLVNIAGASVTVTANSSAHTKGAYAELIASTSGDATLLILRLSAATNATDTATLIDIATGASGSETIVAANIAVGANSGNVIGIPLKIPSGTRLSARIQSVVTGGKTAVVLPVLYNVGDYALAPTSVDAIGTDTATSKGVSYSGAAGTWVEAIASTTQAYRAVSFVPSSHDSNILSFIDTYEIGVGSAGNEVTFGSTRVRYVNNETADLESPIVYLFGRSIPAGSRLAVKHPIAANPGRYGFTLIGIP
jgi:hypothetical protein